MIAGTRRDEGGGGRAGGGDTVRTFNCRQVKSGGVENRFDDGPKFYQVKRSSTSKRE